MARLKSSQKQKQRRGFAAMDPALVKQIASKGGKTAHARGHCHEYTPEEASRAGSKGGRQVVKKYGVGHMAALGRKGGHAAQASGKAHKFTSQSAQAANKVKKDKGKSKRKGKT